MAVKRRGWGEGSIYQRADGRWVGTVELGIRDGKRHRRSFSGETRAAVARLVREATTSRDRGTLTDGRERLADFLERWLVDVAKPRLAASTYRSYKMIVRARLIPGIGHHSLDKLAPGHVAQFLRERSASGAAARTVCYDREVLRSALSDAERFGLVARNVARLVKPPTVRREEIHAVSVEDARRLLAAFEGSRDRTAVEVAIATGLRQGELLGLCWEDLELDDGLLHVRHALYREFGEAAGFSLIDPKTKRSRRTIALAAPTVRLLHAWRAQQAEEQLRVGQQWENGDFNLVFTDEWGRPTSGIELTRRFQRTLEGVGLPRMRWHDLRHAAATLMLTAGVTPRTVMEQLGHSTITLTMNTYAHVAPGLQRDASDRLASALYGQSG